MRRTNFFPFVILLVTGLSLFSCSAISCYIEKDAATNLCIDSAGYHVTINTAGTPETAEDDTYEYFSDTLTYTKTTVEQICQAQGGTIVKGVCPTE